MGVRGGEAGAAAQCANKKRERTNARVKEENQWEERGKTAEQVEGERGIKHNGRGQRCSERRRTDEAGGALAVM